MANVMIDGKTVTLEIESCKYAFTDEYRAVFVCTEGANSIPVEYFAKDDEVKLYDKDHELLLCAKLDDFSAPFDKERHATVFRFSVLALEPGIANKVKYLSKTFAEDKDVYNIDKALAYLESGKEKCPICDSTDVKVISKPEQAINAAFYNGTKENKVKYQCLRCGKEW